MDASMIGSNIGLAVLGGGATMATALAAMFGPRIVKSLVSREVGKLLAAALNPNTEDPKKKELIVALVKDAARLAAYELPNRGQHGPERKNALQAHLERFLPSKQSEVVAELLDEAIDTLDDKLEEAVAPEQPAKE